MSDQSTKNRVPGTAPIRPGTAGFQPSGATPVRISFNQQILIAYAEQVALLERRAEELQRQVLELRQLLDDYQSPSPKQR